MGPQEICIVSGSVALKTSLAIAYVMERAPSKWVGGEGGGEAPGLDREDRKTAQHAGNGGVVCVCVCVGVFSWERRQHVL